MALVLNLTPCIKKIPLSFPWLAPSSPTTFPTGSLLWVQLDMSATLVSLCLDSPKSPVLLGFFKCSFKETASPYLTAHPLSGSHILKKSNSSAQILAHPLYCSTCYYVPLCCANSRCFFYSPDTSLPPVPSDNRHPVWILQGPSITWVGSPLLHRYLQLSHFNFTIFIQRLRCIQEPTPPNSPLEGLASCPPTPSEGPRV